MFYQTNPDAPVLTPGGFLQHTYQPQQEQSAFYYYGDGNINPVSPFDAESRRNQGVSQQIPVQNGFQSVYAQVPQQYAGYPQQNQSIPETQVQAWGTYPPPVPNGNVNGNMNPTGLNALVESRRNANLTTTSNNGANPWLNPQQQQPQQQSNFGYGYGYNMAAEPQTQNLYINPSSNFQSMQRGPEGYWNNGYTSPTPTQPPTIDWRTVAQQQQPQNMYAGGGYNQQYNPAQYPVAQYPSAPQNWREIAEKNFGGGNL